MAIIKYKTNSNTWVPVQLTVPTIEVDSILSDTSTNPVQNKVIKEALDRKVDINAISRVAISGDYSDLDNLPTFATINGQDITQTDHIIIKDKIYPIYSKRLLGQETLNPAQIIANKNAYDSVLANENAVYYFVTNNPNLILMSTQINVLDQSIVFISNITGHSNEEFNIVEVHLTIKPDGNSEELLSNINLLTKDKTQDLLNSKQDSLVSGVNIKTINNQSILIENEDITNIQISSDITVDSVMSDMSENPVQNKVVKNYVDGVVNNITLPIVDSLNSDSATEALSAKQGRVLKGLVDGKMDSTTFKTINGNVITGEGNLVVSEPKYNIHIATSGELSAEQKSENKILFDLAESGNPVSICYSDKQPLFYRGSKSSDGELETISYIANNYLDVLNSGTVMQELLVQVDIDSQGNAYPNTNTHTYYLDNVTAINSKQDTLVSGTNIKTIDNQSLLGSGNIITKTEIIDTLESESTTAALSANQGRILKRMIEELPSGGPAEGAKFYPIYSSALLETDSITEEQKAANKAAFEAATRGDNMWCYVDLSYGKVNAQMVSVVGTYVTIVVTLLTGNSDIDVITFNIAINEDGSVVYEMATEVTLPSIEHVEEMIAQSDGGVNGGLELRELKMSGSAEDKAYNLETLELMKENKVLPAMTADNGILVPLTYMGNGQFIIQVFPMGIEMNTSLTMAEDGSITLSQNALAPYVLNSSSRVLEWLTKSKALAQLGMHEPVYVIYNSLLCLVDCIQAGGTGSTRAIVQFNYGSQRFERVYDANTGEEISTTEIPLGSGGSGITEEKEIYIGSSQPSNAKLWIDPTGTPSQPSESVEVVDNLESESTTAALSANQGRVLKEMISQPSESVEQRALTVYVLPSSIKNEIEPVVGQEPLKGLINEMYTHNADVCSKIVESRNRGEESPIICVDSRKYVQKISESLQNIPPGTLITSTRVIAQMVFSNFDLLKGSSMEDCVNIIYESVIDGLAERIILRPDGSYEADSLIRPVYYYERGEIDLTEANIASNKFIFDNWRVIYSHFSRYIQGAVQKSGSDGQWAGRYLISVDTESYDPKFCVIEAGGTIKVVSINESGLPSITAL